MPLLCLLFSAPFPLHQDCHSIPHDNPLKSSDEWGAFGARLELCDRATSLTAWCFSFLNFHGEGGLVFNRNYPHWVAVCKEEGPAQEAVGVAVTRTVLIALGEWG